MQLSTWPIQPTRYSELGIRNMKDHWRIVAIDGQANVGPYYATKGELLADLDRYATEYGI